MTDVSAPTQPARYFVGGRFWTADNFESVVEAATGEPLGDGACVTESDIDDAVAVARSALPEWRASSPDHRARILLAMADALKTRAQATS